jgi:RNA polymerase sigma-70 factor (ECF subfamily)
MAELDDEQSRIRESQRGDHDAFAALVQSHQRMIHSLTYRMTGSQADAEDLAQETFIQAFRQLGSYRAEARFSSWLYRIAINLCLNWRSRNQRRERLHADWTVRQEAAAGPSDRQCQHVQDALAKLTPKHRAAIVLTVYDGLNHKEAARILGCSETTVSWRVFAARSKLKKLIQAAQKQEAARA